MLDMAKKNKTVATALIAQQHVTMAAILEHQTQLTIPRLIVEKRNEYHLIAHYLMA